MRALKQLGQLAAVALVAVVGNAATDAVDGHAVASLAVGLATAAAALVVYARVVRWTEHRRAVEVAPRGAGRPAVVGTAVGAAMFAVVVGVLGLTGSFHVDGWGSVPGAVGLVGLMAAGAVTEELLFRGVLLRAVQERVGTWVALGVTAALFGAIHLTNPDATPAGALAIALEAGGMLGAAYVATGNLWLPIGLHLGWNVAESALFSTEVSGNGASRGLLDSSTTGSTLLTGGRFGPEASILSVGVCLVVTVVLLVVAHRRGRIVPFAQARRTAALASDGDAAAVTTATGDRPGARAGRAAATLGR